MCELVLSGSFKEIIFSLFQSSFPVGWGVGELQLHSLNYLKKFSSWKIPQGSLSRVLSFRQGRQFSLQSYKSYVRPVQSPTSSEHGSIVSAFSYRASSPPELGRPTSAFSNLESDLPPPPKSCSGKKRHRHRRAKSIGDITVTPV